PELLHNETHPSGASVLVKLVSARSPREGLGARVTVETLRGKQSREASTSGSYASAQDARLHFGLGGHDIQRLAVGWPSGAQDRLESPKASSILVIKEGVGLVAAIPIEAARGPGNARSLSGSRGQAPLGPAPP
ncbi:MAG: ASPIC/UnbV domain-containing protein, partial [Vicinamibacteria bacterium]